MASGVKGSRKGYGAPCAECGDVLSVENAYARKDLPGALLSYCKVCIGKRNTAYRYRVRAEMIAAYGGRCVCCGETEPKFLAIDHINNNGAEDRRNLGILGGHQMVAHLKKLGYPKDEYQLLCHNCNCAKGWYGACPHTEER